MAEEYHWADKAAEDLIAKENKEKYTCAAGITPSGVVHIGNFREVMTVDLVSKALRAKGKKVRFIYSWDDYDVFRKIPADMPNQELLNKFLRQPIVDTPDVYGCHKSYSLHNEAEFEKDMPLVGIEPEFIKQSERYRKSVYAEDIKTALLNKAKIINILNKYRKEPYGDEWYPVSIFCEKCNRDDTIILEYDGKYNLKYKCNDCKFEDSFDFRKKGVAKLVWRVDWPMRWNYEKVDFEPGGKDHSTTGGSFDTGKEIVKQVWGRDAPQYIMYDFISVKGMGGKISSSKGGVVTLKDCLEVYEPEVIRYLFAGTRPNTEFAISFDVDVIKIYEDFDRCERIYFGKEEIPKDKLAKEKRIYELSCIKVPKKPIEVGFRHLTMLVQIYEGDIAKVMKEIGTKDKRMKQRAECAINWINKYAPEDMKFEINEKCGVSDANVKDFAKELDKKKYSEEELGLMIRDFCAKKTIQPKDFFTIMYKALINKEKGPRLASFILAIGKDRVVKILNGG